MVIEFKGNSPKVKYFRIGVIGNNKVDKLEFVIDRFQGDTDLADYTPYLKVQSRNLEWADKYWLVNNSKDETKLRFIYSITDILTTEKAVDVQLSFEKLVDEDILVWQTKTCNLAFDVTVNVGEIVARKYPEVLKNIEVELSGKITEYQNQFFFPNVGEENRIYIDKENNRIYRYDTEENKYYICGSDYTEVEIINCGGNN